MMAIEKVIQDNIRLKLSDKNTKVFRNDNGVGYGYSFVKGALEYLKRQNKQLHRTVDLMLKKGIVKYGLGEGTHDLIIIKKIKITQEMVGSEIGVFSSIEVKDPKHKTDPERLQKQIDHGVMIQSMGGISGFAYSTEDAVTIMEQKG